MPRFNFTFEEASPLITYTGLWMEGSRFNDSLWDDYSADSFRVTFSEGATATLNFAGTGVSLFGAFRPNHGNFSVNLDHGTIVNGDGNANNIFREPLSQNYNLSNIEHFIQATNEPSSAGEYFDLDYVNIERVIGQDKDTIFHSTIDDTSPFVIYDGPWGPSSVNATSNTNGTLHMTTEDNSQIRIVFQACCIELYGLYTNAQYTVTLDDHSPVPMHGQDIDLDPIFWHPNTLLYLIDGLPEGVKHTVTLNTTSTSLQRPFSFDYGIVRSIHNFDSSTSPFSNPPADATTTPVSPPPGSTIGTKSIMSMDTIVGTVVGTTAFLALILIASWVIRKRCKGTSSHADHLTENSHVSPHTHIPTSWIPWLRNRHKSEPITIAAWYPPPASTSALLLSSQNVTAATGVGDSRSHFNAQLKGQSIRLINQPAAPTPSVTIGSSSNMNLNIIVAETSGSTAVSRGSPPRPPRENNNSLSRPSAAVLPSIVVREEDADDPLQVLPPAYNPGWA